MIFTGYTGTFSGEIGGFSGITLDRTTAMTIDTDAADDVTNSVWTFDVSERDISLASRSLLNWAAADFSEATIVINLVEGSACEWTLVNATAGTAYYKFDVQVDTISQGELTFDSAACRTDTIAAGDYEGWGFAEDAAGVLKFAKLA